MLAKNLTVQSIYILEYFSYFWDLTNIRSKLRGSQVVEKDTKFNSANYSTCLHLSFLISKMEEAGIEIIFSSWNIHNSASW